MLLNAYLLLGGLYTHRGRADAMRGVATAVSLGKAPQPISCAHTATTISVPASHTATFMDSPARSFS